MALQPRLLDPVFAAANAALAAGLSRPVCFDVESATLDTSGLLNTGKVTHRPTDAPLTGQPLDPLLARDAATVEAYEAALQTHQRDVLALMKMPLVPPDTPDTLPPPQLRRLRNDARRRLATWRLSGQRACEQTDRSVTSHVAEATAEVSRLLDDFDQQLVQLDRHVDQHLALASEDAAWARFLMRVSFDYAGVMSVCPVDLSASTSLASELAAVAARRAGIERASILRAIRLSFLPDPRKLSVAWNNGRASTSAKAVPTRGGRWRRVCGPVPHLEAVCASLLIASSSSVPATAPAAASSSAGMINHRFLPSDTKRLPLLPPPILATTQPLRWLLGPADDTDDSQPCDGLVMYCVDEVVQAHHRCNVPLLHASCAAPSPGPHMLRHRDLLHFHPYDGWIDQDKQDHEQNQRDGDRSDDALTNHQVTRFGFPVPLARWRGQRFVPASMRELFLTSRIADLHACGVLSAADMSALLKHHTRMRQHAVLVPQLYHLAHGELHALTPPMLAELVMTYLVRVVTPDLPTARGILPPHDDASAFSLVYAAQADAASHLKQQDSALPEFLVQYRASSASAATATAESAMSQQQQRERERRLNDWRSRIDASSIASAVVSGRSRKDATAACTATAAAIAADAGSAGHHAAPMLVHVSAGEEAMRILEAEPRKTAHQHESREVQRLQAVLAVEQRFTQFLKSRKSEAVHVDAAVVDPVDPECVDASVTTAVLKLTMMEQAAGVASTYSSSGIGLRR